MQNLHLSPIAMYTLYTIKGESSMQCSVCNKELSPTDSYCPQCGRQINGSPIPATTASNNTTDNMLLADVNRRLTELEKKIPATKILAHSFWTRSWAIFGHALIPMILLYASLIILMLILGLTLVHAYLPQYKNLL
jgi:hypothetical protein